MLQEKTSLPPSFPSPVPFPVFFPLNGLYWNKSLVTHTAVFLWASQANFDTLIMPSLYLSPSPLPHTDLFFSLSPDLPPSLFAAHWAVQYITVKAASVSGVPGVTVLLGRGRTRATDQSLSKDDCLISGLFSRQELTETGSSDMLVCTFYVSQIYVLPLT